MISANRTAATARRVLRQLRRDPRTIAMLIVVPLVLLALVRWTFDARPGVFQRIGVPLAGIFPLITMFMITSIAMLRERASGTLERLMASPISKLDLLAGYGLAFGLVGAVQATLVVLVAVGFLGLDIEGSIAGVLAIAVLDAILGMAMGLFVSAFARSEFQAVQFMPAFVMPQVFLSGILVPRDQMADVLEWLSNIMPATYAFDALQRVGSGSGSGARVAVDVAVLVGVMILALVFGAATLQRRSG